MKNLPRRWLATLFLFLLVSLVTSTVTAAPPVISATANPSVKMEVKAGFDGNYKENEWVPVQVTLNSEGTNAEPINGRLEASFTINSTGNNVYQREVNLVPPYRKTFWLYMLGPRLSRNMQIRLIANDGTILSEVSKDLVPTDTTSFLIGVISDDSSALNYLNSTQLVQPVSRSSALLAGGGNNTSTSARTRTTIVHLSPSDLPPNPVAMNALDALVFGDLNTTTLSSGGNDAALIKNTISGWLSGGKVLVMAGDSALRKASVLNPLLPVVSTGGPKNLDNDDSLESFVLANVTSPVIASNGLENSTIANVKLDPKTQGATVIVPAAGKTGDILLASRGYGLGTSWFVAPELQNLKNWTFNENFWRSILKNHLPRLDYGTLTRLATQSNNWSYLLTPNQEIRDRFDPTSLIIFLAIYLTIIGPIGYLVLRRFDRREWAWWVIPVVGVIFTTVIYIVNTNGLEKDFVVSRTAVVMLGQGNDQEMQGVSTGIATLYSNRRNDFNLNVEEDVLFGLNFSDRYSGNTYYSPTDPTSTTVIKQGAGAGYKNLFLGLQQKRSFGFESEAARFSSGGIRADVSLNNGKLQGTLENTTDRVWEDVMLFIPGGTVQRVGNIKAKEKKTLSAEVATPGTNLIETLVNTSSAQLLSSASYRGSGYVYPFGLTKLKNVDGKLIEDPDYQRAAVLESIFGLNGEGLPVDANRFYLIGWSKSASLPFNITTNNISQYDLTLLLEGLGMKP